jgi:phage terminase small subunit
MARELTLQQRQFVASYLGGASATQAAIDAGYSAHSAKSRAHVLTSNKLVKAELDRVRNTLAKKAEYSAEQCAAFIDTRIARAEADKQHSAAAKYHEQKMKLYGLLIDKQQIDVNDRIDLRGALEAANARVNTSHASRVEEQFQQRLAEELRLRCDSAPPIEGQFVALPDFAARRPTDEQSVVPPIARPAWRDR